MAPAVWMKSMQAMTTLPDLPDPCLVIIMASMPVKDILLLGITCKMLHRVCDDASLWHELAVQKWGSHVPREVLGSTWKAWCCKRMSFKSIMLSPLNLLQEAYPDPWQHITACVLCSRTSGSNVIRSTIHTFFIHYPSPSKVLDADQMELASIIHPLGLPAIRIRAVKEIAEGFLISDWDSPSEFYGCGKFVHDSWMIFCRGHLSGHGVADKNLKQYVSWSRKYQHFHNQLTTSTTQANTTNTSSSINIPSQPPLAAVDPAIKHAPREQEAPSTQKQPFKRSAAAAIPSAHSELVTTRQLRNRTIGCQPSSAPLQPLNHGLSESALEPLRPGGSKRPKVGAPLGANREVPGPGQPHHVGEKQGMRVTGADVGDASAVIIVSGPKKRFTDGNRGVQQDSSAGQQGTGRRNGGPGVSQRLTRSMAAMVEEPQLTL